MKRMVSLVLLLGLAALFCACAGKDSGQQTREMENVGTDSEGLEEAEAHLGQQPLEDGETAEPDNTQRLFDDETISSIAAAHGKSSPQAIIRGHLQAGNICIPVFSNEQHIIEDYDVCF